MKKLKALLERRVELQNQMDALVTAADTEERAMTEEETTQFDAAEAEIRAIDATVAREERARNLESPAAPTGTVEERAAAEEQAFADYVLGRVSELRAGEQNMTMANNGAIIPTSIADRIIILTPRPGRIKKILPIHFPADCATPLKRRNCPEFSGYFNAVWKELKTDDQTAGI